MKKVTAEETKGNTAQEPKAAHTSQENETHKRKHQAVAENVKQASIWNQSTPLGLLGCRLLGLFGSRLRRRLGHAARLGLSRHLGLVDHGGRLLTVSIVAV